MHFKLLHLTLKQSKSMFFKWKLKALNLSRYKYEVIITQ